MCTYVYIHMFMNTYAYMYLNLKSLTQRQTQ